MTKRRRTAAEPIGEIEQTAAPEIAATIGRISAVLNDPLTPGEAAFRLCEAMSEEMDRMFARLDTYHPAVIRRLYPLLAEFRAAGLIHDPAAAHAQASGTTPA